VKSYWNADELANRLLLFPTLLPVDNQFRLVHNHSLILLFGNTPRMNFDPVKPIDAPQLMARAEDIEIASRSLKAMSHPLRLKILCTLGSQEVSVQEIVDNVGTSQSNISQHLAILRDKGILASRKDANRVYYRVGDARTLRLIGMMQDVFCSS
jgi:ArsR family transcriptional regulator